MKVLYLTQVHSSIPDRYKNLSNIVALSYKERSNQTAFFAPNTSWTEGRNLLIYYAHNTPSLKKYDYYCLLDEDLELDDWSGLEKEIETLKPEIAIPRCWDYSSGKQTLGGISSQSLKVNSENYKYQTVDFYDAACNYFSRKVFFDSRIFPYVEKYDKDSWWTSQFIHFIRTNKYYPNKIVQFNRFKISNTQSSRYPRGFKSFSVAAQEQRQELGNISMSETLGFNWPLELRVHAFKRKIKNAYSSNHNH